MTAERTHYRTLFDLSGRVAVVTGAIGFLGRHFCAGLADHGARVAVVDLDAEKCGCFAAKLTETYGTSCIGISCDITNIQQVQEMADKVEDELGNITILHNNAQSVSKNLDRYFAPTETYDLATWHEIMSVNLDGAFLVAQEIGQRMAARQGGSIIQTGSIYGILGPDQRIYEGSRYMERPINSPAVYSASKAGLTGLSRYLAAYWGHKGVRVNTLTPGGVYSGQNEIFERRYSARVPMGRMANPDELVGALIFLASDASRYVNGQDIVVDGGLSAW